MACKLVVGDTNTVQYLTDLLGKPGFRYGPEGRIKEEGPRAGSPELNIEEDSSDWAELCSGDTDHNIGACSELVTLGALKLDHPRGCLIVQCYIPPRQPQAGLKGLADSGRSSPRTMDRKTDK